MGFDLCFDKGKKNSIFVKIYRVSFAPTAQFCTFVQSSGGRESLYLKL